MRKQLRWLGWLYPATGEREDRVGFTIGKVYNASVYGGAVCVLDDDGTSRNRSIEDFEEVAPLLIDQLVAKLQAAGMPAQVTNKFRANYTDDPEYTQDMLRLPLARVVSVAFVWGHTPEGHDYWHAWHLSLRG